MHTWRCVCVLCESVSMPGHTCTRAGVCGVQHRFVSGHTGSCEGGSGSLVLVLCALVALDTLCCPVPSPWGGAGPGCALSPPTATCRQSTWPGPWALCAICPRCCLVFTLNLLTLPWEVKGLVSLAEWGGEEERRARLEVVAEIGGWTLGLGRLGRHHYCSNFPQSLCLGRGK